MGVVFLKVESQLTGPEMVMISLCDYGGDATERKSIWPCSMTLATRGLLSNLAMHPHLLSSACSSLL
jgi:hypothetical protein